MLIVSVPLLPPSTNHMYITTKRGGKALSEDALAFRTAAGYAAKLEAANHGWCVPDGPLEFTLRVTVPNEKRRDIDNFVKAALDTLAIALGFDDRRVARIVIERAGTGHARCEMTLAAMEVDQ